MKTMLLALCALLSVADAFAQQYILPIGSNVNNRVATVSIIVSSLDTWARVEDTFDFYPSMGNLEDVVRSRAEKLLEKYQIPTGFEQGEFALNVQVTPGPFSQSIFRFQQDGTIPPEMLEVKLDYGVSWTYKVKGVKEIRMRLFKNGKQTASFSTANPNDSYGFDLSPCSLGTTQDALARDEVRIESAYTTPSLWDGTWDYGEMDVVTDAGDYAVINLLNGFVIQYSTLDFMEFLRVPEIQSASQAPVLTISQPHISRIARVGHTTEITVSTENSASAHLEFSETLSGSWYSVPKYPQPLNLQTGSTTFTHTTESLTTFYRLRVIQEKQ